MITEVQYVQYCYNDHGDQFFSIARDRTGKKHFNGSREDLTLDFKKGLIARVRRHWSWLLQEAGESPSLD